MKQNVICPHLIRHSMTLKWKQYKDNLMFLLIKLINLNTYILCIMNLWQQCFKQVGTGATKVAECSKTPDEKATDSFVTGDSIMSENERGIHGSVESSLCEYLWPSVPRAALHYKPTWIQRKNLETKLNYVTSIGRTIRFCSRSSFSLCRRCNEQFDYIYHQHWLDNQTKKVVNLAVL